MFILYALLAGTIVGVALRGHPSRLSSVTFHWRYLVVGALVFQVVLFAPAVSARVGDLGPLLYVGSTSAVLAAVLRNFAIPGVPIVALGSMFNLAAILANGGYMPMGAAAAAALGKQAPEIYSNSAWASHPALEILTDIFALPSWVPFANVFSIGDVVIGVGVAWAIARLMTRGARPSPRSPGPVPVTAERLWRSVWGLEPRADGVDQQHRIGPSGGGTSGPFAAWDSRRTVRLEDR